MIRARMIAPVAGLVLLAGCSMPSPSVAVQIGDEAIKESTVTKVAEGCASLVGESANALRLDIVRLLTQGAIARQVAAAGSIDVSQGSLDKILAQATQMKALKANAECAQVADSFAAVQLVVASLGESQFIGTAAALPIRLNPRYGTWTPQSLSMAGTGSISQLAK